VFFEHGKAVADGLRLGIESGISGVNDAAKRMAGAVSFGASAGAGGTGSGGVVIHLEPHITVPGGFIGDPEQLAHAFYPVLQKVVLEVNRRNPGTGNGLTLNAA
jgi:hypothetical protein